MRKYIVAFVCLFIGCAAGSAIPTITAQSFGPNPSAQRWEQFCDFDFRNLGSGRREAEFNDVLAARGREGWEYMGPASGYVTNAPCFKRPVAP